MKWAGLLIMLLLFPLYDKTYAQSNDLEILDIHTEPSIVYVNDTFRINATIINNTPYTIQFAGLCDSPLSAEFDDNVKIEYGVACLAFSLIDLKPGEKVSVSGPAAGITYRASHAGLTNATITFEYIINEERRSVSKQFIFMIHESIKLDREFKLKINQTAYIEPIGMSVKLSNISDSRCPSDVVCVWKGEVRAYITVNEKFTLTLTENSSARFDTYVIKLVSVNPYPTTHTKPSDYSATLLISKEVSVTLKATKKVTLLSLKNLTDTPIYGIKLDTDGGIQLVNSRGWDSKTLDNSLIIETLDKPIVKYRNMVFLIMLERYSSLTWTIFDREGLTISSGILSSS